ncbi:MAG: hypothetical protein AAGA18_07445 [Verrucomicrobiota bacterium]
MNMSSEHIQARLHLRAVIPTLVELVAIDETAQKICSDWNFNVCFSSCSGIKSSLGFQKGAVVASSAADSISGLKLLFLSDKQVNNLFLKSGLAIPIPVWGFRHLPTVTSFSKLTDRLEEILKAPVESLEKDSELLYCYVRLLIQKLIPCAVTELALHEAESQQILGLKKGMVQLVVNTPEPTEPIQSWIHIGTQTIHCGVGIAPQTADFVLIFRNLETALLSIRNEMDTLAAASGCEVNLQGNIPLGEAVSLIMERIGIYIS